MERLYREVRRDFIFMVCTLCSMVGTAHLC